MALDSNTICIVNAGNISESILQGIKKTVEDTFMLTVNIKKDRFKELESAYRSKRKQYYAFRIIEDLGMLFSNEIYKILAITDVDIFDDGLHYLFGEAYKDIALVSVFRLSYGKSLCKSLLLDRTIKTAIHELGHTYSFEHCEDQKCVMYFSKLLADTDNKTKYFCVIHEKKLFKSIDKIDSGSYGLPVAAKNIKNKTYT